MKKTRLENITGQAIYTTEMKKPLLIKGHEIIGVSDKEAEKLVKIHPNLRIVK